MSGNLGRFPLIGSLASPKCLLTFPRIGFSEKLRLITFEAFRDAG
jgi:hypothetical protein